MSGPHPDVVEAQQYVLDRAAQRKHARAARRARNYVKRHVSEFGLGDVSDDGMAKRRELFDEIRHKRWLRAWAIIAADRIEKS